MGALPSARTSLPEADAGGCTGKKGLWFGGWSSEEPSDNSVWGVLASWVPNPQRWGEVGGWAWRTKPDQLKSGRLKSHA